MALQGRRADNMDAECGLGCPGHVCIDEDNFTCSSGTVSALPLLTMLKAALCSRTLMSSTLSTVGAESAGVTSGSVGETRPTFCCSHLAIGCTSFAWARASCGQSKLFLLSVPETTRGLAFSSLLASVWSPARRCVKFFGETLEAGAQQVSAIICLRPRNA